MPVEKFVHLLAAKQDTSKMNLGPYALKGVTETNDHADCFSDALAGLASLKSPSLSSGTETCPIAEQFVCRLRSHPSLEYLSLTDMIVPDHAGFNVRDVFELVRSTKVLKMLRLFMDGDKESAEILVD
jgi:hypothetical protein